MIPFAEINAAALACLDGLLADLFPAGQRRGHEYVVGNLRGDPGESLSININTGKWADFASDVKGGDPISLFAAAHHGGDQAAAARELGRITGVYLNGEAASHVTSPAPASKPPKEDWRPGLPPENPPSPPVAGFDHVYVYRDSNGTPLRYIGRKDAKGDRRKLIIPISWGILDGVEGWHKKHAGEPRCLYGLDRLAAMPDRVVVVTEGEKACDAAQTMLPDYPCVTWSGGTNSIEPNDWPSLAGRRVIIWPDNDAPGHKAATLLRAILRPIAAQVETLYVDDLPEGADAADVRPSDAAGWLRARLEPEPAPPGEYIDQPDDAPDPTERIEEGVIPLGHDRGIFYYYSRSAKQVYPLAAGAHSKNTLAAMASVAHHWQRSQFVGNKGAIAWDDAIDWMMRECRRIGIYDPDRIRGRGAWMDNGRAILHVGDKLIVDGRASGLMLPGSPFIYEAAKPLATDCGIPLSTADANRLVEICKAPSWHHGISGLLLAGFIVVAPICGGLAWRPSIWITGGAGSGKSYLKDNILAPAMGGMALLVQSKTTEAGIRQTLNCDARPVLFDEAEREDAAAAVRMQGVLDLLRQSSSEGGAEIVKGSQTQTGAKRYRIRSCFAFSSINVGVEHQADESRITVLALRDRDPRQARAAEAKFIELNRTIQATITPAFAAGLLSRSVRLLPIIRANAEAFARAVAVVFGSRRAGDQLGALLAGAYALHSERTISDDAAEEWVRKQEWTTVGTEPERDESRLLSHLTQWRTRINRGNSGAMEVTIGRLMQACDGHDPQVARDEADLELRQNGIRWGKRDGQAGFWVSDNHPALKKILAGTPWSAGWKLALGRLPDAVTNDRVTIRFAFGHVSRAAWVPWRTVSGGEDADDDAVHGVHS